MKRYRFTIINIKDEAWADRPTNNIQNNTFVIHAPSLDEAKDFALRQFTRRLQKQDNLTREIKFHPVLTMDKEYVTIEELGPSSSSITKIETT